eukprot:gene7022-biopygen41958
MLCGGMARPGERLTCAFSPLTAGQVDVVHFGTEGGYDQLNVAGTDYDGDGNGLQDLAVDPSTAFSWAADSSVANKGWHICVSPVTPEPVTPSPSASPLAEGAPTHFPSVAETQYPSTASASPTLFPSTTPAWSVTAGSC